MAFVDSNTKVRQLLNRLDDSASSERLNALSELNALARSDSNIVGNLSIRRIFVFLYEQGTIEEFQECLDLLHRLVKNDFNDASNSNSNVDLILAETSHVELLLDLLEHEDLTVAVMANEILTDLHNARGAVLENHIQNCPAGKHVYHDICD